ncbi:hypothetical protein BDN70DRAFT_881700 [Pholiota conissans]|uniref:DUF6534 domain-containing protein n=1 Tax=Pholiota conissans TaxID=109636 RepID=A0A9P5YWC4_9AGAR|nr:hypothetical protein BDN70DRAFT_881700 [Pholiota conissans]
MASDEVYTNVATPFAPVYWGFVISLLFGGVTIVQAYIYFREARDHILVKLMAAGMLLLDFVDSALVAYSVYYYLIPRFGSVSRLGMLPTEMAVECLIATLITTVSQCFFVYQLVAAKRLGKGHWSVIGGIVAMTILALAGGIACVVTMAIFSNGVLQDRNRIFVISFGVSKAFGAAADIVATIAMCLFLNSVRTGMIQTNSLLDALVRLTFSRGILVTVAQTLLLITFYATPGTLTWVVFHINVPKLYVNTFFAMLNGRDRLKAKHLGTSVKLEDTESSRGKIGAFGSGEHSTLVGDVQHDGEKRTFTPQTTIIMSTEVTTSVC